MPASVIPPHNLDSGYIGRFAPSPSGPLHLGSLVTALGSYLQAKSNTGKWLVRIDDLDPPREMAGASQLILETLLTHGMQWDDAVLYQSARKSAYEDALNDLISKGLVYNCSCTRKQVKQQGNYYQGECREKQNTSDNCSIRFLNSFDTRTFYDNHLGQVYLDPEASKEDFIIRRKDGYFAYHLAAVIDDIYQNITEIVRGADLLQPTMCQIALYDAFKQPTPAFVHLPVLASIPGLKLSKQNHAKAINNQTPELNLIKALELLGLTPPDMLRTESAQNILYWATANWSLQQIPRKHEILVRL